MRQRFAMLLMVFWSMGCDSDSKSDTHVPSSEGISEDAGDSKGDSDLEGTHEFVVEGFSTPESALYDLKGQRILVSNINDGLSTADDNGFISVVSLDGELETLKWIDGADEAVTLNAPKGMGIVDDRLYISDITIVRVFNRETGAPETDIPIEDASFLNDIAVKNDTIFVSDSSTGTIHRIAPDDSVTVFVASGTIQHPNGLAVGNGVLYAVTGAGLILKFDVSGKMVDEFDTGVSQLDGLVILPSGDFLVSSWEAETVFLSTQDEVYTPVATGLVSPADIDYYSEGGLVLVPLFQQDRLVAFSFSE